MMRSEPTPMTRAASTYSLLRSTSVEPRTVRAYCTQPVSAMASTRTTKASASGAWGNRLRAMPLIINATRMDGKDSITSQTRITRASTRPPTKPANKPRLTPNSMDSSTEAMPTSSDMRVPYIRADRMSRPCPSVPSRYLGSPPASQAGGLSESSSSSVARSNGLCGATTSANSAQVRQTNATPAASIATGELRKECQTSPLKKRCSADIETSLMVQWDLPSMRSLGSTAKYRRSTPRLIVTKISEIRQR
mmetsp:Transcript_9617/g.22304  ORF Transcript_9617/g.22304 Transcript_9617/m.22304 type:complete len:250 (-) Transcript_9617:6741-7490(-)